MRPETHITAEQITGFLRRRAFVIVACVFLVAGSAFVLSKYQTKMYTATTVLLFSNPQAGQQVAGLPAISIGDQQAQQNTNVQLVQLGDMAAKTAAVIGHGITPRQVGHALSFTAVGDTNLVDISAVSASPARAAAIANTYSAQFVQEQESSNQQYYASALALVVKQYRQLSPAQKVSSAGLVLQDRAQSLAILASLRSGTVKVAQSAAVPSGPSSPKTRTNTALAALLGLIIGFGVAVFLERSDRLIREPRDLADIYGLPLLGVVRESAELARLNTRSAEPGGVLVSAEAETFHLIRAHLRYFNVDRELRLLLIASPSSGDGKTTVACHLAAAAARMGSRVLVVEADLRRPTIAARVGLPPGAGVSDILIGLVPPEDAIQTVALDASGTSQAHRTLDVLSAGSAIPPNPGELMESHAMAALLEEVKARYDLIVVDTPPLTVVSDAFPLLRKVDGVIIVGRVGRDRRDVARRLHETLNGVGATLLGVIANGHKESGSKGYSYGYSYAYTPDDQLDAKREVIEQAK